MQFGSKLKEIRKEKGLSQKELGKKLGVSQAMIAQYENGERTPKIQTAKKITTALGVSLDTFMSADELNLYNSLSELYLQPGSDIKEVQETSEEVALRTSLNFNFISLNLEGKQKVVDYSEDLRNNGKYTKKD